VRLKRSLLALLLLVALAQNAQASEPAPDPARGESYDGRPRRGRVANDLLMVPRILLAPLRLLWRVIARPVQAAASKEERDHVSARIVAALTSADGQLGFRPQLSYTLSFTPLFGLMFFDHRLLGPNTGFNATLTFGSIGNVMADVYAQPTRYGEGFRLELLTSYHRRNDQVFAGIGRVGEIQPPLGPSRYLLHQFDLRARVRQIVSPWIRVGADALLGVRRFGNGNPIAGDPPIAQVFCVRTVDGRCIDGVDERLVPGFNRGTQFARLGAWLQLDTRDSRSKPSSGAVFDFGFDYTHGFAFDESNYFRLHAGLAAVLDLWQRSRVLVLSVLVDDIQPIGSYPVPFSELVVLGGPTSLRGVRPGRFRDFSSLLFSAAYRWPIWMWLDAELFADYGGVFARGFDDFHIADMQPDVGGGLLLRTSRQFLFGLQAAYGFSEGWQLFVVASTVVP
jgi:hypothetical protein